MKKEQRDKKIYYIAGIISILGLFLLIGVWPNYFEHEVKNDKAYTALSTNTEMAQHPSVKSRDDNVSQPKQCAIDVNVLYNLVLLGVLWWLKHDYATKLGNYLQKDNASKDTFKLQLNYSYYILAAVVLSVMVGYISYFLYQHLILDRTCAKDMKILCLVMPLLHLFIIGATFILAKSYIEICCLVTSLIGYWFVRWLCLQGFLFKNKRALLKQGWSLLIQRLCTAFLYAYFFVHSTVYIEKMDGGIFFLLSYVLLSYVLLAFFYVQVCWSPQPHFSSGYKIIDYLIPRPFHPAILCLGLWAMLWYDVVVNELLML